LTGEKERKGERGEMEGEKERNCERVNGIQRRRDTQ